MYDGGVDPFFKRIVRWAWYSPEIGYVVCTRFIEKRLQSGGQGRTTVFKEE